MPFDFFLHIDKKINQKPFDFLSQLPNVYFIKNRIRVRWASYSFLMAVQQAIFQILRSGTRYDFISIMSGQDYPIIPVKEIFRYSGKKCW